MDPITLSLLGSLLPGLFSSILGNPAAQRMRQANRLASPQNLGRLTNQYYQNALGGPAFSQAQGAIAAGANATGSQLASKLGAAGIGGSGTGALLSSLLPSLVGSQQAGLRTAAWQSAQGQAQDEIQRRIAALMGQGVSPTRTAFAGGIESALPALLQLLSRTPGPRPGYSLAPAGGFTPQ